MKKTLLLLPIIFALLCVLISCGAECEHNFTAATCDSPMTCTLCGATEGTPIKHSFLAATCESPKTCQYCQKTEGVSLKHVWESATCDTPRTCTTCGSTDGEALGHKWSNNSCTKDKTCTVCGFYQVATGHNWNTQMCEKTPVCLDCYFMGEKISHDWEVATCLTAESCKNCGAVNGEALGHKWKVTSCKEPKVCQRCEESSIEDLPHRWVYQGCEEERRCNICLKSEGTVYGHSWVEATCYEAKYCTTCDKVEGTPAGHDWKEATCLSAKACQRCKLVEGVALGHNWELTEKIEPLCEDGRETYTCSRCQSSRHEYLNARYGYHICRADGYCTQCDKQYDPDQMKIDSVLITNDYAVECCGIFTSYETDADIYKPVTYKDIGMPVVDLGGALPTSKGNTKVVEFVYESGDLSFTCTAEIKVQGASSASKPKKNFNIKLFKDDGSKNKVELQDGWGKENKYCMKANYVDYSQSRNVVSGKLFGQIVKSRNDELSDTPNGGAIDGYPILVYNNGTYQGIYTMNIPKDNWMFDMKHSDEKNQAIFMASTWNQAVSFKAVSTSGFTLEFASNEDSLVDKNTQWAYDSLLDLIEFVYNNDGEDFKNGIHEYADIEKCIDSMLYTFFICADDNTSKNILWVTLDGKVWFSSMYDMDGTWGMRWNGNIEFDENTPPISALADGAGLAPERSKANLNLLWERIYVNYFDLVSERYKELRQEILTYENISAEFEAFFDAIPDVVREAEKQKWTGVPSQNVNHLDQILNFALKRLAVMDKILLSKE